MSALLHKTQLTVYGPSLGIPSSSGGGDGGGGGGGGKSDLLTANPNHAGNCGSRGGGGGGSGN